MRWLLAFLLLPALVLAATQSPVALSWAPTTLNNDGTPATVTGYRVEYGQSDFSKTSLFAANITTAAIGVNPGDWQFHIVALSALGESLPTNAVTVTVLPFLTAGPYSYEPTGTATAPTMSAIGLVEPGLSCGPSVRLIGTIRFCQITRDQTDLIGWPKDKTLAAGVWARAQ